VASLMKKAIGLKAEMWGPAIDGFGRYHYKYDSGRQGDMPIVAFSPRKDALTLYLMAKFPGRDKLFAKLGKHKSSKACLIHQATRRC
jgi:hypothetical protein